MLRLRDLRVRGGAVDWSDVMTLPAFKTPTIRSRSIRESARGESCAMRIPGVCNGNPETTVWAHSNRRMHGKGLGLKAHDIFGFYACSDCHRWYDELGGTQQQRDEAFLSAHAESLLRLIDKEIIDVG